MAGNMLMINVGVNSKDAENSLASLEETLKNISKKDADLKVGENLATEVENARKKYLDMVKMVNSTEGELQKAFAISGLKQTIADIEALNKKISETGAKIKPIELQSVMFDGKELFDIKGIDKSLNKFAKKLDKESNDAFANILTTNLGQQFFSKQKIELEKQLETDLKNLAKDFSQDKLEQYINKYLKIRSIDVAKNGKDKIATSGVTPKAITDLIDNKTISKQLAEGKIDVKAMFQKKATDVGFVKNMKDQIFSELMAFLNQNTDANTFGTKYTDAQMTEMTQGAKESKKQIKLLKEEFIGLINQYNGFNRNSKIELVLDTVARIESLRKELKGLGQDISEINNIEKQDEYKENLNTLKYTLIPDGNDDYYDEDFDTYLLKLKNDFNKLNNTNIQSIMSMNIGDEKKIEKLKENLTQIDELLIKTNSYDSIVPNVSSEVIGDIEILKKQREQIIAGLKKLNVDVAGVGIPMADYIAGGNKGSGGNSSGTGSGDGDGNGAGSGTGNGGVMTPEEMEKLKKDYADLTAEVEKYKAQITETTAKLEEMKKTQAESDGDKSKIKELQASLDALNVSYAEAQNKMKEYRSELAAYESMSLVQDANGNNVNQEQYDKLISDAKQTATELENTRNQLKMLQEQAAAGGSDEYVVQLNNQLKSTEAMLDKVTNELEYMESSRNRWMDRAEMNAVIDESGQSVYQNDYDNIVAKLSEMKTEAQNAKEELENLKATSVQLGEGEQVAKTSDIEAVKGLSEAVKNLQERMTKAEEILQEVPKGRDGLKKLSSQIKKMSGNFNEDGSIKSMGISAETLSEQLKNLEAEFDARIAKKIEEIEKKSYKENQPNKKLTLVGKISGLKTIAKSKPTTETTITKNDSAEKGINDYTKLITLAKQYNEIEAQHISTKNDKSVQIYQSKIDRLEKMKELIIQIRQETDNLNVSDEKIAEKLNEITLNDNSKSLAISDSKIFDTLLQMIETKIQNNQEVINKRQADLSKYDNYIKNFSSTINNFKKTFQSILSMKMTKKNTDDIYNQLNTLFEDITTNLNLYNKYTDHPSYSEDFAKQMNTLQAQVDKVATAIYQADDIGGKKETFEKSKAEFLIGYKPPKKKTEQVISNEPTAEDLRLIEQETQDRNKNAQAIDNEAEALSRYQELKEKGSLTSAERVEYSNLRARMNREQESNIVSTGSSTSSKPSENSGNATPPDNATLSAILTEVKSINGKMDKPVETKVNNNTGILSDSERYELESYKKRSKDDQALNLWSNYGYDSIQLTKAKINSFSGTLNELIQAIKYELEDRKETIVDDLQNPSGEYDDDSAYSALGNVQQLSGLLEMLNNSGINNGEKVSFDSKAIDNILAEVKAISQKMGVSNTKASNNASPNISANQSPNNTPSSVTTPSISSEVQAASEAATAEVAAFTTIDDAVTGLTGHINTKTEAIRAEATEMVKASQIETSQIGKIVNGVIKLKEEIKNIPKISVTGKNTKAEPIKITAEISDEQIEKIRQRVLDAFGEKNPIPIFFKPNVQSIKKQINNGLKDGLEKLTIQSFDFENAAKDMKKTLANAMSDVGLQFDTNKLRLDIKTAVNAARDAAESVGRGNPSITASGKKNAKGGNVDPKKLDRLYASFERDVTSYYNKNTLILRDQEVNDLFSKILNDIKKQPKSKENLDVLYRRFSEAQIAAINKGLDFNADKSDIGTAVINKGYETLISQINKYLETNTKIIGSQFEEEFSKLLSEASKPAQARTDVDLKQLGAEFARLKNYVDEAGLSGNADNEAKKVSKLDRGYATLALDMKKFHEENNKLDKSTEWADKFNKLFNNITGSISRSDVELEDFRAQFVNFKNEIPRDLLGSTVTSEFFENLKGYDIDSIAKIFEKQSGQVKSKLLGDKYGFESPKMTRDVSQMLDAQADRLTGLINQDNVSDNDIDGIVQHNKQLNNLISTYQTYSEKRRVLQEQISKDGSNAELQQLLQESNVLSNSQVYDAEAMKKWSERYVETINNLKNAQIDAEKEERNNRSTSAQQNQYRTLTKDIEEATATAQRFKEQYAGLISDGLNAELNQSISDMSARSSISVDLSNSGEITTWNDESKKLLDTWAAIQERIKSSVVASGQAGEVITATMDYSQYTRKATNALSNLNNKYKDKLKDKQSAEFEQRLEAIRNKVKEISDDTSKYTANNVQVIETDIQQLEKLAKDFEVVQNSENKINSLIRTLSNSRNSIERRGSVAQPVVSSIDSEKTALEELKRQGQSLDIGNPESVRAFVEKLNEADTTVNKLKNDAEQIRISTNTTASVAKLDSKFNDLLFKVDKFRRDNSKITSDKGIAAQFDSLMRSIQTIEKSDVNFQRLRAQFDQLKATVQGKGLTGRSLGDELKYIAEKIGIKAMLGNSIYRVIGAFRQMVGIVTELDTGMTTLRRVTEETEATYRKFLKTAGDEAHELGSTVSGLVDSTGDFARLGYNIQEANALAKNAVMYSNVGWLDIQTATADMTSTMKAFNIEASDSIRIVDTFDILGKKLPLVTISVKGWRHSRPSKDIVNHNICVTTAGGVW